MPLMIWEEVSLSQYRPPRGVTANTNEAFFTLMLTSCCMARSLVGHRPALVPVHAGCWEPLIRKQNLRRHSSSRSCCEIFSVSQPTATNVIFAFLCYLLVIFGCLGCTEHHSGSKNVRWECLFLFAFWECLFPFAYVITTFLTLDCMEDFCNIFHPVKTGLGS